MKCAKCGMAASKWKCALCGKEADEHDTTHAHGEPPSDRHCMPMCDGCQKAEVHCAC